MCVLQQTDFLRPCRGEIKPLHFSTGFTVATLRCSFGADDSPLGLCAQRCAYPVGVALASRSKRSYAAKCCSQCRDTSSRGHQDTNVWMCVSSWDGSVH